jgi:hypothetical protein
MSTRATAMASSLRLACSILPAQSDASVAGQEFDVVRQDFVEQIVEFGRRFHVEMLPESNTHSR